MLRRALASSRYVMIIAVVSALIGSFALIFYEAVVVLQAIFIIVREGTFSAQLSKVIAVGLIEAVDVFLIAVTAYLIGLSLYSLFIDDSLPLPRWLQVHDLEDLKRNLVSLVIAVLAVLFLHHAMTWEGGYDLAGFGAAVAIVIVALTIFLARGGGRP